jgi:hypothetical protein
MDKISHISQSLSNFVSETTVLRNDNIAYVIVDHDKLGREIRLYGFSYESSASDFIIQEAAYNYLVKFLQHIEK